MYRYLKIIFIRFYVFISKYSQSIVTIDTSSIFVDPLPKGNFDEVNFTRTAQLLITAEMSEDEIEDDQPVGMHTDRNAENTSTIQCTMPWCNYSAKWKQLTKHCVREHERKYIPNSQLPPNINPRVFKSVECIATKGPYGLLIQSLCHICNELYNMFSEKWLKHYISHTGESHCETKLKKMK